MRRFIRFIQVRFIPWLWQYAGAVSIRVKVLGIVLSVILLLGMFVIFQIRTMLSAALINELESQGLALSYSIEELIYRYRDEPDDAALVEALNEQAVLYSSDTHNTQVEHFILIKPSDMLVVRTDKDIAPLRVIMVGDFNAQRESIWLDLENSILQVARYMPEQNSTLYIALSLRAIIQTVNDVSFQLFSIMIVMIAVGFAAAFFLTWVLTRPILDLVEATDAVAKGDFTRRVPRWANDEIGELASAFNSMIAALEQADQERLERERMRQSYINGVILAQENERQRIARELHDSTSQSLTSLLVGLQNLRLAKSGEEISGQVDSLRDVIAHTLNEVRSISWQLRPTVVNDLGLVNSLVHYIDDFQKQHHLSVDLVTAGLEEELSPELETTIYRVIQEALTNVARYAQANAVSVIINSGQDMLKIIVEDDGVGFDPEYVQKHTRSLGLKGIRERAGLFDGKLTIESSPGQGSSLFIEIPHPQEDKELI